jgi:hypothetical protein
VRPFLNALRTGLQLAESDNPKVPGFFKPGDAEHLRRWLSDGRAVAIFDKLSKGKEITQRRIVNLILTVLAARQIAEATDKLNATFAELKRTGPRFAKKERRHAMKQFADGDASQEALAAYLAHIDEAAKSGCNLDPLFIVRSDRAGSRKRTIFCRILSEIFHGGGRGRWHDAEVAALCEIAFDCDVTIESVKHGRNGLR